MDVSNRSKRGRVIDSDEMSDESEIIDTNTKNSKQARKDPVFKANLVNFDPIKAATWTVESDGVPFAAFAQTMQCLENTRKRLDITQYVTNLFRAIIATLPNELLPAIYLCLNKVAPDYEGVELGIGESVLIRAIAEVTGRKIDTIKDELKVKGDLGSVAESSRSRQKIMFPPKAMTIGEVFRKLKEIATMSGKDSTQQKLSHIKTMFVACKGVEAKYFIRSLQGTLRVGLAEQSILVAIAHASARQFEPAVNYCLEEKRKAVFDDYVFHVKEAFSRCSSYDKIIETLLQSHDVYSLESRCTITPGIPIKPMLAHPTKSVDEILKRFKKDQFVCEYKYDGERAQVHILSPDEVRLFSRNSENNSGKFPDVAKFILNAVKNKSSFRNAIIDSEIVAYDRETKEILPFQVLTHRKRKNVDESEIKINVCVFAFDLLYFNDVSLVDRGIEIRRKMLHQEFSNVSGEFSFVTDIVLKGEIEKLQDFLDRSIADGCEGLIVKLMSDDATYEISKRSNSWLKLKKDYLENVGDSFDLVVMGGYYGTGKRGGLYGGFLLGCYDADDDEFQSICKVGTGFSDDDLNEFKKLFDSVVVSTKPGNYQSKLAPDVWFNPKEIWEVKCADLSVSPVHIAGLGLVDDEKGISLRFPRFVRRRTDKATTQATTNCQVADMYSKQIKEGKNKRSPNKK